MENNKIIGDINLIDSKVKFIGNNNILYIDGKVNLENTSIEFRGDNSLIYICETDDKLPLDIKIYNNSTVYIGKNMWINKGIKIVVSEETNVFFGEDCLVSYDTCIRTADPHLLYDIKTKQRINEAKSIYVGDHVWIGQHVFFLKGTKIGSGAVIGALSNLTGKTYKSNCSYGGNPARILKKDVFFLKLDSHRFTKKEKEEYKVSSNDKYIYNKDKNTISFDEIENNLNNKNIEERISYLKEITNNTNKNRFYIS